MTTSEIRRRVEKIWAVRMSGNRDAAERATRLELDLYRAVLTDLADRELHRRDTPDWWSEGADRWETVEDALKEIGDEVIQALSALPTARTWRDD